MNDFPRKDPYIRFFLSKFYNVFIMMAKTL